MTTPSVRATLFAGFLLLAHAAVAAELQPLAESLAKEDEQGSTLW